MPARLAITSVQTALSHWLDAHGVTAEGATVTPPRGVSLAPSPSPWPIVLVLDLGGSVVVRVPDDVRAAVDSAIGLAETDGESVVGAVAAVLGERVTRTIGPTLMSVADRATLAAAPPPDGGTLGVVGVHDLDLQSLRLAVADEEWEHSALGEAEAPVTVVRAGGVVAASGWTAIGRLAHLGVLSHPDVRGRGYGRAAAADAARRAMAEGLLPQWQTLEANGPSVAVGRALGFTTLARRWALRLAPS